MHLTSDKRIWIPDDDDWVNWGGNYEQDQFNEVMPHVSKWDVALDVGAHVGIWSMRLAQRFKKVYAFEPVPKHIECWKENMSMFKNKEWDMHENISILETVALGHENGTAPMKVPNTTNTGMASLVYEVFNQRTGARWVQPGWDKFPEIVVETRTLDSYEFDVLDFIKIDVEWFELRVLQGAENTIRKHKPVIYIEMHDTEGFNFMKNLDLDYRSLYAHGADRLYKVDTSREWKQHIKKIDNLKGVLKSVK
jgi:FkbM family methyltransferase